MFDSQYCVWMTCRPDPLGSGIEYWVNVKPLRCFRCSNIGCYVQALIPCGQALNIESMFACHSDTSMFQYWCYVSLIHAVKRFRCSNIGCYVSLIHAGSSIEYWVNVLSHLIVPMFQYWMLCQPDPCGPALDIEWTFATSMFPVFQYWMPCQPDPCGQVLNIESIFSRSDVTSVSILNDIPSNIETMETWEWPKIDSIFNAWSQCSGWHVI